MEPGRRHQLQERNISRGNGRLRCRARAARHYPAAVLADGYCNLQELMGLRYVSVIQDGLRDRGRPGGYRQQERLPAAEHWAAAGRNDPRAGGADIAGDWPMAGHEWRGG